MSTVFLFFFIFFLPIFEEKKKKIPEANLFMKFKYNQEVDLVSQAMKEHGQK